MNKKQYNKKNEITCNANFFKAPVNYRNLAITAVSIFTIFYHIFQAGSNKKK